MNRTEIFNSLKIGAPFLAAGSLFTAGQYTSRNSFYILSMILLTIGILENKKEVDK